MYKCTVTNYLSPRQIIVAEQIIAQQGLYEIKI